MLNGIKLKSLKNVDKFNDEQIIFNGLNFKNMIKYQKYR